MRYLRHSADPVLTVMLSFRAPIVSLRRPSMLVVSETDWKEEYSAEI